MSISKDLFLAILSMDSYNRGYNPWVKVDLTGSGNRIGAAELSTNSSDPALGIGNDQAVSFFAQSYTWNGQTIIAYRGTDQLTGGDFYL